MIAINYLPTQEVMTRMAKEKVIFTIPDLAAYLEMKPATVEKYARNGLLPGFKIGPHWRFRKETIDRWLQDQEKKSQVAV